jgi:hypothetical protein
MAVFTSNGFIKSSLRQGSPDRGTGVWGSEINRGTLAYIEKFKVNSKYQRQGVGRWAIESLLTNDALLVSNHPWELFDVHPWSDSFLCQSIAHISSLGPRRSMNRCLDDNSQKLSLIPGNRVLLDSIVPWDSAVLGGHGSLVMLETHSTQ